MNDLLLSEINTDQEDLLRAVMLIEEFIFEQKSDALPQIEQLVEYCEQELADVEDPLAQAEHLINVLFLDLLLLDTKRSSWPVGAFKLETAVAQREIHPVLKAIVIKYIAEQCGFEVDLVFVPEKIMLRLICDQQFAIIFDPLNGESLNWEELDHRLDELTEEPSQYLDAMDTKAVLVEYLTALKNALIHEQKHSLALRCVDVLITLKPEDPFERRDRGFLLHQLDCFKVAYDDYQYFVNQCPQDPAAQILKLQLDNIKISNTILH
ncbi:tetratricopeptide repeat protein [Thalassotalea sp. M1531]|uniref:Tetratricopeptide repeat protein n=1 Tax=Thalassotalea algicola TaxID=2716224 RepID=A0A7Y0Q8V0_9GAMM|nr:tetratricopeptide repeat protein [Thalassotalea algicola]NMP33302.1 tetratricopeptide repeat protein [Thalassotalea algicola]